MLRNAYRFADARLVEIDRIGFFVAVVATFVTVSLWLGAA